MGGNLLGFGTSTNDDIDDDFGAFGSGDGGLFGGLDDEDPFARTINDSVLSQFSEVDDNSHLYNNNFGFKSHEKEKTDDAFGTKQPDFGQNSKLANNYNFGSLENDKGVNISLLNNQELFGGLDRDHEKKEISVKEKEADKGPSKHGFDFNPLANNGGFG